ncbi:MAG: hypothetical protein QS721_02475 [Candidatus Endonucleobacter sp. (ex Gigantidas childressi)]|nr:hypothetical protein [Candidatus Endonucleobacter sp. (ex Gigantidas childressi)]
MLAALAHPDHLLLVGSWGFAYLPPSSNLKSFGYIGHEWLDWFYVKTNCYAEFGLKATMW